MGSSSKSGTTTGQPDAGSLEQQIFGLLQLADAQQSAVQAGLEGLALERAALATERAALAQQAAVLQRACEALVKASVGAMPQMAQASATAATRAVEAALAGVAEAAIQTAAEAARPAAESLAESVRSAAQVQHALRQAVSEFGRKWTAIAVLAISGAVLAAGLVSYGTVWWERRELGQLAAQRDQLAAEVNALREQAQAEQARRSSGRRPAR